jgi:hypothetical protein
MRDVQVERGIRVETGRERFTVRIQIADWDVARSLFAEADLIATAPGSRIDLIQTHSDPGGWIDLYGVTPARNLDGLTIEFGEVKVTAWDWAQFDIAGPEERSSVRKGPFDVGVLEGDKRSILVGVDVDRRRLVPEADPQWLVAALEVRDRNGVRLAREGLAVNHRGGAAEFVSANKRDIQFPLRLRFPVPSEVERSRRGVTFEKLPLPE